MNTSITFYNYLHKNLHVSYLKMPTSKLFNVGGPKFYGTTQMKAPQFEKKLNSKILNYHSLIEV